MWTGSLLYQSMESLYSLITTSKHEALTKCWFNVGPPSQIILIPTFPQFYFDVPYYPPFNPDGKIYNLVVYTLYVVCRVSEKQLENIVRFVKLEVHNNYIKLADRINVSPTKCAIKVLIKMKKWDTLNESDKYRVCIQHWYSANFFYNIVCRLTIHRNKVKSVIAKLERVTSRWWRIILHVGVRFRNHCCPGLRN